MAKSKKAKKPRDPWSLARELEKLGKRPPQELACQHCQAVFESGDTSGVISLGHELARRRLDWDRRRAELLARDEKERTRAAKKAAAEMPEGYAGVAAVQEAHAPTERIAIRDNVPLDPRTGQPIRRAIEHPARMRAAEARLMGSLDEWQKDAAQQIVEIAEIITGGVAVKPQKFERSDPIHHGSHESQWLIDRQRDYFGWARDLQRLGIDHAAIFQVLVHGKTLGEVDDIRRRRNGWAKAQVVAGLDLWCWRAGWKKHPGYLIGAAAIGIFVRRLCGARTVHEATRESTSPPVVNRVGVPESPASDGQAS